MGLNYFIYDGESSLDHGAYVGGQGTFNAPQRDVSKMTIPGRNGDLIIDNKRFLNIQVPYNIVLMDDFKNTAEEIRAWLMSSSTYKRLEDSYDEDHFRLATVRSNIQFETSANNLTGRAKITFDCKPQRFLKDGEIPIKFTESGRISNPTRYESRPLIKVNGTGDGVLTIGNQLITIKNIMDYLVIDSELQDCYKDTENCNGKVTLGTTSFPVLPSGFTGISFSGGISSVEITGRWWTL